MRNYLKTVLKGKPLMHTPLVDQKSHWVLYRALVAGAVDHLKPSDFEELTIASNNCDVSALFKVTARIDSYLTEYDENSSISTIRVHRQLVSFLKKYPFTDEEYAYDRRQAGQEKFLAAETQCQATNLKLRELNSSDIPSWVPRAQRIIAETLGYLSSEKIMKIISQGNNGPGATLTSVKNRTTPYYKFMDFPYSCTKSAMPYATAAISSDPTWLEFLEASGRRRVVPTPATPTYQREMQIVSNCVEICNSDKVTFVPKDAHTERPIAIGASLNMYLQLGVKEYIESRLCVHGIDLKDQSRNQRYAKLGSQYCTVSGSNNPKQFSTIDLASASDTISYELVKLLLDPLWFAFLCDLRHESGQLNGETFLYEKFSAMGNGFTFPLETLIFWACSKAALDERNLPSTINDLVAYGDDIICREEGSQFVIDALVWSGFSINTEKSFLQGPFKESCGADYFRGHDVRAFYLKRQILTYEDIYFVGNSVAVRSMDSHNRSDLQHLYDVCISLVPVRSRRYSPLSSTEACGFIVPLSYYRVAIRNPFFDRLRTTNPRPV